MFCSLDIQVRLLIDLCDCEIQCSLAEIGVSKRSVGSMSGRYVMTISRLMLICRYLVGLYSSSFHQSAGSSSSRSFAEQKDHSAGASSLSSSNPAGSSYHLMRS